jgi:enoyl-CoA hydratase
VDDLVLLERRDAVLVVTLHRPTVHNVLDQSLTDALIDALAQLDGDESLRAGVLTGSSTMFCAGLDLKHFAEHGMPRGLEDPLLRRGSRKPLVAAIEGIAFGGGLELALVADLRVAATNARFAQAETKYGLFPSGGGLLRLPASLVREMVLTAAPIDAERALRHGLVDHLVEPGEALSTALELAQAIAANPPAGVQAAKRILDAMGDLAENEVWALQAELAREVFATDDAKAAVDAFVNRSR